MNTCRVVVLYSDTTANAKLHFEFQFIWEGVVFSLAHSFSHRKSSWSLLNLLSWSRQELVWDVRWRSPLGRTCVVRGEGSAAMVVDVEGRPVASVLPSLFAQLDASADFAKVTGDVDHRHHGQDEAHGRLESDVHGKTLSRLCARLRLAL